MKRVLTGYAVTFNRQHGHQGHLFHWIDSAGKSINQDVPCFPPYHLAALGPGVVLKCYPDIQPNHIYFLFPDARRRIFTPSFLSNWSNRDSRFFSMLLRSPKWSKIQSASTHSPILTAGAPFSMFLSVGTEIPIRAAKRAWVSFRSSLTLLSRAPRLLRANSDSSESMLCLIVYFSF